MTGPETPPTTPRWTVEEREPRRLLYGREIWLDWDDIPAPAVVSDLLRRAAFDALVAAVNAANRLPTMEHELRTLRHQLTADQAQNRALRAFVRAYDAGRSGRPPATAATQIAALDAARAALGDPDD
jgi:hypothetical protein